MIEVRVLPADRLGEIAAIDRSEHIDRIFEVRAGNLVSRSVDIDVPRWETEGTGPHSVGAFVDHLAPILERGGALLAAFDQDDVVGVAVVEDRFDGDMAWLAFLHVTRRHRRRGVASALWAEAVNRARAAGARSIYVSAAPTGSAVGFYLARGCTLVAVPHLELYAEEPEDVHLVATLRRTALMVTPYSSEP